MSNLAVHGATVCKSVLSSQEAHSWKNMVNEQLETAGACIKPIRGSVGRRHCFPPTRKSRSDPLITPQWVSALSQLGGEIKHDKKIRKASSHLGDIAKEYFAHHGIEQDKYGITELQLLNAENNSNHQIWHRDNAGGPGLTALIALEDIGSNGPTEILLGSHESLKSMDEKSQNEQLYAATADIRSSILLATLNAGDAILYDARVLHRGRGYHDGSNNRPVLIIRWDVHDTPPPGTGFIGTQLAIVKGTLLVSYETIKDKILY